MSYGASDSDAYRRAGSHYVPRILKGANPGDLPVEMPSKYELVVNVVSCQSPGGQYPAQASRTGRRGYRIKTQIAAGKWHFSAVPTAPSNVRFQG